MKRLHSPIYTDRPFCLDFSQLGSPATASYFPTTTTIIALSHVTDFGNCEKKAKPVPPFGYTHFSFGTGKDDSNDIMVSEEIFHIFLRLKDSTCGPPINKPIKWFWTRREEQDWLPGPRISSGWMEADCHG